MSDYSEKFEKMRIAGKLAAQTLDMLTENIKEGISTAHIDKLGYEFIRDNGGYSAPLYYRGFKKSLCTSLNHVVCHGVPSEERILEEGDAVNVDVTAIVNHGLENNLIKELKNNDKIKSAVFFNKETRFDFLLKKKKQKSFIEVKNVTLFRDEKTAEFPDAITSRGSKHLLTLIDAIKKGYKTYLIFLVQIQNMEYFKIAKDIDNEYYDNYLRAKKAGVNFLAYRCKISSKEIFIDKKIKIIDE